MPYDCSLSLIFIKFSFSLSLSLSLSIYLSLPPFLLFSLSPFLSSFISLSISIYISICISFSAYLRTHSVSPFSFLFILIFFFLHTNCLLFSLSTSPLCLILFIYPRPFFFLSIYLRISPFLAHYSFLSSSIYSFSLLPSTTDSSLPLFLSLLPTFIPFLSLPTPSPLLFHPLQLGLRQEMEVIRGSFFQTEK